MNKADTIRTSRAAVPRSITGYGAEYECVIGPRRAKVLLEGHDIPPMGSETVVKVGKFSEAVPVQAHLRVQNVSGTLVLTCYSVSKDRWETVFGIEPR